jgi:ABC-type nitrate/sulfonate/bicarbonate transport system substrate-binding protein
MAHYKISKAFARRRSNSAKVGKWKNAVKIGLLAWLLSFGTQAFGLETVHMGISTKSFQLVIYPLAQERGYMAEEGLDLRIVNIQATPSIQAMMAGDLQFTGSGGSALLALVRGSVPVKVVFVVNDRVLQWLLTKPNISSPKDLKGKKIVTTGIASVATFMLRQILTKYGLDGNKDVTYISAGANNQLTALMSGVADAAIVSADMRYIGLDNGMKELFYFGDEVKNSWGALGTSDRLIKEKPKVVAGFIKATLKALRFIRQDREATVAATVKFSGINRAQAMRIYDDLIGSFTRNGAVDEETQKNDLLITRQVAGVTDNIPIARAFDFSFALNADQQLTGAGWRP